MNALLRKDADQIIKESIAAVLPDEAVRRTLKDYKPGKGRTLLVATGKAAWQMAKAAVDTLGHVDGGVVVTKYEHVMGEIPDVNSLLNQNFNTFKPYLNLLKVVRHGNLDEFKDICNKYSNEFESLLSGGGSALFELPRIPGEELQDITRQLLASGADIVEMNTIRKRLSAVKGGRFALACAPAKVLSIVLSDILGDPLDMIASGPAYPDSSTCAEAKAIAARYGLKLSADASRLLDEETPEETPKELTNVETHINGSVRELCAAAAASAEKLGYEPVFLTDQLSCEAREAGSFLASILKSHATSGKSLAFIAGGETVVHLTGHGLGGRNQELALAAAPGIAGTPGAAVFSVGSDGTDGPTDAAGGYTDGDSAAELSEQGLSIFEVLKNNDAYHALEKIGGLVVTGPTGTNVNDVAVALLRAE